MKKIIYINWKTQDVVKDKNSIESVKQSIANRLRANEGFAEWLTIEKMYFTGSTTLNEMEKNILLISSKEQIESFMKLIKPLKFPWTRNEACPFTKVRGFHVFFLLIKLGRLA